MWGFKLIFFSNKTVNEKYVNVYFVEVYTYGNISTKYLQSVKLKSPSDRGVIFFKIFRRIIIVNNMILVHLSNLIEDTRSIEIKG